MNQNRNLPVKFVYPPECRTNIKFANQFAFVQVDMDVVMDICVVDPKQVLELNQKWQSGTARPDECLEANVIHRVGMSISSLVKLKQQLDQIVQSMEQQGVLVKKMESGMEPGRYQ